MGKTTSISEAKIMREVNSKLDSIFAVIRENMRLSVSKMEDLKQLEDEDLKQEIHHMVYTRLFYSLASYWHQSVTSKEETEAILDKVLSREIPEGEAMSDILVRVADFISANGSTRKVV